MGRESPCCKTTEMYTRSWVNKTLVVKKLNVHLVILVMDPQNPSCQTIKCTHDH